MVDNLRVGCEADAEGIGNQMAKTKKIEVDGRDFQLEVSFQHPLMEKDVAYVVIKETIKNCKMSEQNIP